MNKTAAVIEESHCRGDSTASVSKSLGSLVHINSIAVDISSAMEETEVPAVHEHFSIRGFVAGMRKKDLKTCLPFSSDRDSSVLIDDLPPISVPKFRWWQCSGCIPEVTGRSTAEMAVGARSDAVTRPSQGADSDIIGNRHGSKENGGTEATYQRDNCTSSDPCCTEQQEAAARIKDGMKVREKDGNPCADKMETNPVRIRDGQNNAGDASRAVRSRMVHEPNNSSSGSDAALNALPHRRRPKLRSLAAIMVEETNPSIENLRTKSASSCGVQASSAEIEADLGHELQSDSPSVIVPPETAKGTRSPQRKRKITLEEERVPLVSTHPTAKRSRGIVLDAERSFRPAEVSDSESEGDASVRLDLRLGTKAARMKPKKNKNSDMSRRMRQTNIDMNGAVQLGEVHKGNATCSADFQKEAGPIENSFTKLGFAPSTLRETGSYFGNFMSGQQTDRISNASKSKRPEVEADHEALLAPSKNTKAKVTLDLSLNSFMDAERSFNNQSTSRQHRGIPDLNETFSHKTAVVRGNQLPNFSEKRSLTLHKTLDISASGSKDTAREDRRQLATSERQTTENNIEMEIIELLAKNQHERALGNSRNHLLHEGPSNSVRGTPPAYVDRHPAMFNFPVANRRGGLTAPNGNTEMGQNVPMNFGQLNKCQLNLGKPDEGQFRLFSSFAPSQPRKTQQPASTSMLGPRHVEGAELFWPPRAENVPFQLSAPQNHSYQNRMQNPFMVQSHKGKTISDVRTSQEKKAAHDASMHKEGRIGPSTTPVGSVDQYANDTIPAMQLLSLMDQGIVPGPSYKEAPKNFLDKPFSPCNHHPRSGKENQSFLSASFFSQGGRSKNFPEPRYSIFCSGESSKKAPSHVPGHISAEQSVRSSMHVQRPKNLVSQPARSESNLGECLLNRNPADFSIPDANNEFTISSKDLKPKKRNAPRRRRIRPRTVDDNGQEM